MAIHKGRNEAAEIKMLLQLKIQELCLGLLPDGHRAGKYWIARNPARQDKNKGSFWVALSGVPGSWRDEATGEKGDVWQLIMLAIGCEFRDAVIWAKEWTAYEDMQPAEFARQAERVAEQQRWRAHREAERLQDKRGHAQATWLRAAQDLSGTIVEKYLATRGIVVADLARPPRAIRAESWHRHAESGKAWPCMMTAMSGPDGRFWAVHRTWLQHDGSGKAPVDPVRKIWPSFKGATMRLSRGETGLDITTAVQRGVTEIFVLCEGVEDGLSIALARPDLRVWAAGSLGNLQAIMLPACCREVIIAADNDWGKPQAMAQLHAGCEALARQGVRVRVARSPIGKDMNDALMGGTNGTTQQQAGTAA